MSERNMTELIGVKKNIQNRYFLLVFCLVLNLFGDPVLGTNPQSCYKATGEAAGRGNRTGCGGITSGTSVGVFVTEKNIPVDSFPVLRRSLDIGLPNPTRGIIPRALIQKETSTMFFPFNKKQVHLGCILRWWPGGWVLLGCRHLTLPLDALQSRRDRS